MSDNQIFSKNESYTRQGPLPVDSPREWSESHSVVSNSSQPHGLYSPWSSPGRNTGVGSLSLLQGIFPTQGSNPGLPHLSAVQPKKSKTKITRYWASLIAQWVRIHLQCRRPQFDPWVRKICWRRDRLPTPVFWGFPGGSAGKESAYNAGDLGWIPGLGRSPGEGQG